jgi:hypothetical protein
MKIIKKGKVKKSEPERVTCIKCGCVFEYESADVTLGVVTCPHEGCGNLIQVGAKPEEWPWPKIRPRPWQPYWTADPNRPSLTTN